MTRSLVDDTLSENSTVGGKDGTDEGSSPPTTPYNVDRQEKKNEEIHRLLKTDEEILNRKDGKLEDKFKRLVLYNYMKELKLKTILFEIFV